MEVLRDIGARLDQVTESAQTEELSPAIRAELDSLRAEIRSVTPPPTRSRLTQQPLIIGRTDAWISDLFKTQATHSFQGLDAVKLSLQIGSSEMARYGRTVKAPTGATYSAIARELFSSALVAKTYSIVYPDEFEESEPLRAGHYEVEWRPAPLLDPTEGTSALTASLAQAATPPVATDSFTIPERAESSSGDSAG